MQTFQELATRRRFVAVTAVLAIAVTGIARWTLTAREAQAQSGTAPDRALTTATAQTPDQPEESRKAVLAEIEKLGGEVVIDEKSPGTTAHDLIEEFSSAKTFWQQGDVARKLIALGDKKIIPEMKKHLGTADRRRRCNAALVLAGLGENRGLAIIIGELEDKNPRPTDRKRSDGSPDPEGQTRDDRYYAALLLGQLGKKEAVPALIVATTDKTVNYQAAISLGEIGDKSAMPALRQMARDFPDARLWAGYGLAALGDQEGFDILTEVALSDPRWTERRHAVEALGKIGNPKTARTLEKALQDEDENVRASAARVLRMIEEKAPAGTPAPPAIKTLRPPGTVETPPTPETLEKWLVDKEWIEIVFAGPHMNPLELRDSLTIKGNLTDFRLTPGEGGRPGKGGGAFVEIGMKVTPKNVRRVLALQAELAPRGYVLEGKQFRVWSYQGDTKTREQAGKLVPEVLAALEQALKQAVPGAKCTAEKSKDPGFLGGFAYELPDTNVKGSVHMHSITSPLIDGALAPDQTLHLPHLGLIGRQVYRGGRDGNDENSAQRQAIRQAFIESVEPLLKLEASAVVSSTRR